MGKARVAPTKVVTIPRLELTAGVISDAVSKMLKEELGLKTDEEYFWTDSKVVIVQEDAPRNEWKLARVWIYASLTMDSSARLPYR